MILSVVTPTFQQLGEAVMIGDVHVMQGEQVKPGSKLFDCTVDLSGTDPHDCPPQTLYRVSTRDGGWIRALTVRPGQIVTVSETLAILSADPGEDCEQGAARSARLAIAAILPLSMW